MKLFVLLVALCLVALVYTTAPVHASSSASGFDGADISPCLLSLTLSRYILSSFCDNIFLRDSCIRSTATSYDAWLKEHGVKHENLKLAEFTGFGDGFEASAAIKVFMNVFL